MKLEYYKHQYHKEYVLRIGEYRASIIACSNWRSYSFTWAVQVYDNQYSVIWWKSLEF